MKGVIHMHHYNNESIGRSISFLNRYGSHYINEQLREYNLSASQYPYLAILFQNEGLSQDEIASILKIDKGTAARSIAKLEQAGYVERKVFNVDKRIKKLYLTDKAHSFQPKLTSILLGWNNIITKDMSEEEAECALKLLNKMTFNAGAVLDKMK